MWKLQFDGGSRGNPGPGGAGTLLYNTENEIVNKEWFFIPYCTNNEAEYTSLIIGLNIAIKKSINSLHIEGDSKLVIEQVQGNWKVKAENLKPFHARIQLLLQEIEYTTFKHIPRKFNTEADALANKAMDTKESGKWVKK